MQKLEDKMEYVFGLVGIIITIFFITLAIIYDGNCNPFLRTISSLGDYGGKTPFSIGFIIAGCLGIPFYIRLEKTLKGINEIVRRIVTGISIVSCVALALIGVIPSEEFPKTFLYFHGVMALIVFNGICFFIGLYSYLMYRHEDYNRTIPILGLITVIMWVIFWIVVFINPIVEWILVVMMFTWMLFVVIHKLRN